MRKSTENSLKKIETNYTENDLAFIQFVKDECKRTGVKCDLRPTKYVKAGMIRCAGWFDEHKLVVAMDRPDSLSILVHEYCHLTQWDEKIELWDQNSTACAHIDEWLGGKRKRDIKKYLALGRDLELDNEKRSVAMIKKWKLNIDVAEYTKKANAYVLFYNWMYHTRRWSSPSNSPYKNPILLSEMSPRFNMKYTELTPRIYKAFSDAKI